MTGFTSGNKKYEISYANDGSITIKETVTSGSTAGNETVKTYKDNKITKLVSTYVDSNKNRETVDKEFDADGKATKTVLTKKDKDGKVIYSITDNNGEGFPNINELVNSAVGITNEIKFSADGTPLKIENGQKATINADGTVEVTLSNGQVKKYDKDGNLTGTMTQAPTIADTKITFPNGTEITKAAGDTAVVNDNYTVTVTSADGKTVKLYNNDGSRQYTVADNNSTTAPNLDAAAGKIKFTGSATYTIQKGDSISIRSDGTVIVENGNKAEGYNNAGTKTFTIIDNNGSAADKLPNRDGDKIKFSDTVNVQIKDGQTATINSDGTVSVVSKDGKTVSKYVKAGTLQYAVTDNNGTGVPNLDAATGKIKFSDTVSKDIPAKSTVTIDKDGNVEMKDSAGKIVKKYDKTGKDITSTGSTSGNTSTPTITSTGTTTGTVSFPGTTTKVNYNPSTQTATVNSDKTVTVASKDGKTATVYKTDGSTKYTVSDQNGTAMPNVADHKLKFSNNTTVNIPDGARVQIGSDGYPAIFSADGKTRTAYNLDGTVLSTTVNNNTDGYPQMLWVSWISFDQNNATKMLIKDGETATINADKTVTVVSKDGKTTKKYDATGKDITAGTTPQFDYDAGKITFPNGTVRTYNKDNYQKPKLNDDGTVTLTSTSGNIIVKYNADGSTKYVVQDTNNTKTKDKYPNFTNEKIVCDKKNGKNAQISIPEGARVVIKSNNYFEVISADKKTTTVYDRYGTKKCTVTDNNGSGVPNLSGNNKINFGNKQVTIPSGATVVINSAGTVTITKTNGQVIKYNVNGKKVS